MTVPPASVTSPIVIFSECAYRPVAPLKTSRDGSLEKSTNGMVVRTEDYPLLRISRENFHSLRLPNTSNQGRISCFPGRDGAFLGGPESNRGHQLETCPAADRGYPGVTDLFERRCLFFSAPEGFREVLARGRQMVRQWDNPTVVFDGRIPGPWEEFTTAWRVVLKPPTSEFLHRRDDWFFWQPGFDSLRASIWKRTPRLPQCRDRGVPIFRTMIEIKAS